MRHPLWLGPHVSLLGRFPQRPLARVGRPHPVCALGAAFLALSLSAARVQAGELEEANGRLVDLEERVRVLSTGFRETPTVDATPPAMPAPRDQVTRQAPRDQVTRRAAKVRESRSRTAQGR